MFGFGASHRLALNSSRSCQHTAQAPLAEASDDGKAAEEGPQAAGDHDQGGVKIGIDFCALPHQEASKEESACGHDEKSDNGFNPGNARRELVVRKRSERFDRPAGDLPEDTCKQRPGYGAPEKKVYSGRTPTRAVVPERDQWQFEENSRDVQHENGMKNVPFEKPSSRKRVGE